MENPTITYIDHDESFRFKCHQEISCFNECCQNLQQVLSPYDIIRLKHHLSCDSSHFLKKYTTTYTGPETGLPIVELKNKSQYDLHCIFVSEKGCLVYPNRPSTCRYYPLGRLVSKNRETGTINETFIMICESHCKGHHVVSKQYIDQWRKSQDLETFDKYNDMMIHLIAAKNKAGLKKLSETQRSLVYKGCYDIDAFRKYAIQHNILTDQRFPFSIEGDIQCLVFAIKWLEAQVIK